MKPLSILAPIVAGLLVVLTYLLVQGTAPDAAQHERTLNALRTVIVRNAALQRDVLLARAGRLRTYDPLVRSIESLREAAASLAAARTVANGEVRAAIDRRIDDVAAAVRDQEALLESFKSNNALLQNSLSYFNHLSDRLAVSGDSRLADATAEVGALTAAMFRFIREPQPESASEVTTSLDRLARRRVDPVMTRSFISHSRLIVATLPTVDELVTQLQAAPTSELTRALQDTYLDAHERAAWRAGVFRTLLYVAALALVAYVAYLFVRLRNNAQILRERLKFEDLIASISTQFINLPRDQIRAGIDKALARLVEHAGLDCARIIVSRAGQADVPASHLYCHPATPEHNCSLEHVAELALNWSLDGYERQGCIYVSDVHALPESQAKASLERGGVRSWLCIPMRVAGERVGVLVLDAITKEKHWSDDDIALFRTAAEIFANAIARERNESERETLQVRLNQSQRLEAIGTLAGGIAHEFNNILGAILGHGEMALATLRKNPSPRRHVERIMTAGERAQGVVEQVLAFGRRRDRQYRPMQVEPVVAEAIDLIRASFPATLSLRTLLSTDDASIKGDATELQQVVMNLCTNAAQAMGGRGMFELELDAIDSRGALELSHGILPAGRYIRLIVRDTGHGIDPATMERIFEPFFTTKPAGQGTGLGLSTVHGIVTAHGGAINVKSRPSEGTTFEVYLPRMEEARAHRDETLEPLAPLGHGQTILIVDDDKALVMLGEEMLAALGYEPVGFDESTAALKAFRANPLRFDLVLTDEIMPEMTGTELASAMHEIRPDLPTVLMTGYDRALQPHRLQASGIREVLRKPLLSRSLANCLARQLLDVEETAREISGR